MNYYITRKAKIQCGDSSFYEKPGQWVWIRVRKESRPAGARGEAARSARRAHDAKHRPAGRVPAALAMAAEKAEASLSLLRRGWRKNRIGGSALGGLAADCAANDKQGGKHKHNADGQHDDRIGDKARNDVGNECHDRNGSGIRELGGNMV